MNPVVTILVLFVMTLPVIVVALVFSYILTRPGHIFESLYNMAEESLPDWLFKPLGGCPICFAGQCALWLFPFLVAPVLNLHYNFFLHVYFICQTIFNILILKHFYLKIEVENLINDEVKEKMEDPPEINEMKNKKPA